MHNLDTQGVRTSFVYRKSTIFKYYVICCVSKQISFLKLLFFSCRPPASDGKLPGDFDGWAEMSCACPERWFHCRNTLKLKCCTQCYIRNFISIYIYIYIYIYNSIVKNIYSFLQTYIVQESWLFYSKIGCFVENMTCPKKIICLLRTSDFCSKKSDMFGECYLIASKI